MSICSLSFVALRMLFLCSPSLLLSALSVAVRRMDALSICCSTAVAVLLYASVCFSSRSRMKRAVCNLLPDRAIAIVIAPSTGFRLDKKSRGNLALLFARISTRVRTPPQHRRDKPKKCARARKTTILCPEIIETNRTSTCASYVQRWHPPKHLSSPLQPILTLHFRNTFHTLHPTTHPGDHQKYPDKSSTRIW